jgi:hypothetical protein
MLKRGRRLPRSVTRRRTTGLPARRNRDELRRSSAAQRQGNRKRYSRKVTAWVAAGGL